MLLSVIACLNQARPWAREIVDYRSLEPGARPGWRVPTPLRGLPRAGSLQPPDASRWRLESTCRGAWAECVTTHHSVPPLSESN